LGGIVGRIQNGNTPSPVIERCYAIGLMNFPAGMSTGGGILGANDISANYPQPIITKCYYNSDTHNGHPNLWEGETEMSTEDMKDGNMYGWNFSGVWETTSNWPQLQMQRSDFSNY
jgi:hypothetical protein